MLAVGDLLLRGTEPDTFFALVAPALRKADLLVGQGELPFTSRGVERYYVEVPTEASAGEPCDPANMGALASAGFDIITLAGNHIWDAGAPGIEDLTAGVNQRLDEGIGAALVLGLDVIDGAGILDVGVETSQNHGAAVPSSSQG